MFYEVLSLKVLRFGFFPDDIISLILLKIWLETVV
jgi:hypothetical protein